MARVWERCIGNESGSVVLSCLKETEGQARHFSLGTRKAGLS